jgi:hypothetical protein
VVGEKKGADSMTIDKDHPLYQFWEKAEEYVKSHEDIHISGVKYQFFMSHVFMRR